MRVDLADHEQLFTPNVADAQRITEGLPCGFLGAAYKHTTKIGSDTETNLSAVAVEGI